MGRALCAHCKNLVHARRIVQTLRKYCSNMYIAKTCHKHGTNIVRALQKPCTHMVHCTNVAQILLKYVHCKHIPQTWDKHCTCMAQQKKLVYTWCISPLLLFFSICAIHHRRGGVQGRMDCCKATACWTQRPRRSEPETEHQLRG